MTSVAAPTAKTLDAVLPCWLDFCALSDEELGKYDIAVVNLACAAGLPGAEVIDVLGCLKALDEWAKGVRWQTEYRIESEFRQNPAKYDNSEPLYRMVKLVNALQQHCGVTYDPAKRGAKPDDPFDLHEHFIYGPIQGPGGTCATLPILYAAVGRRLGYPIKLVTTGGHMFCRWDDPEAGVRLNIDGACDKGLNFHPDDHYRKWPRLLTPDEERLCGYLHSMTPREELADFVARRGCHWREVGNYRRAICAYVMSGLVGRTHVGWFGNVKRLAAEWGEKLRARRPPGFPRLEVVADLYHRRWPRLTWEFEKELRFYEAAENILDDPELEEKCWAPMRLGKSPAMDLPDKIVVDCTGEELCSTHP